MVSDNTLNAPQEINGGGNYRTYDATAEEDIHAVVLALQIFGVERYDQGPTNAEDCSLSDAGRGCLQLNGGIIQKTRGAVGQTNGHGYIKRYYLQRVRGERSAAVLPDHRQVRPEPGVRAGSAELQRHDLVRGAPEQLTTAPA